MDQDKLLIDILRQRVIELMNEKGIKTVKELERRSDVPDSTLAHFLAGETKDIRFSHVVRLAQGFSLTPAELLDTEAFNKYERKENNNE